MICYIVKEGDPVSRCIMSQEQPHVKSVCNAILAKITLKCVKDIYIFSFYKLHENDEESLNHLWSTIRKIPKNSSILILGDFNMLSINWSIESIIDGCSYKCIYVSLLENLLVFNLQQMVTFQREEKSLSILFTTLFFMKWRLI